MIFSMILAVSISSYSVIKRSFAVIGFVGVDGVWLLTELCVMAVFSCLILSLSLFSLSSRNGVFSSKSSDISSRWSNSCWFCSNCACSCGVRLSLLSAAGDRLTEWFALCPTARDVQLKGEAAQVVVFTCGSLVFAVAACLSWGSSVKTKGKRSLCPYDNHATSNL